MAESSPSKRVGFLSPTEFKVERVFPIRNLVATGPKEPSPVQRDEDALSSAPSAEGPSPAGGVKDDLFLVEKLADVNIESNIENQEPAFLPPPWPEVPPKSSLRSIPESQLGGGSHEDRQTTERARLVPTTSGPPGISPGLIVQNPSHCTRTYFYS